MQSLGSLRASPISSPAPPDPLDHQLAEVRANLQALQTSRDEGQQKLRFALIDADIQVRICNQMSREMKPLVACQAHLLDTRTAARIAEVAGGCLLAISPAFFSLSPVLGAGLTVASLGIAAGSWRAVRHASQQMHSAAPQIEALATDSKARDRLDLLEHDVRDAYNQVQTWDSRLHAERHHEEILLLARGVAASRPQTIQTTDETVTIGPVQLPRRF